MEFKFADNNYRGSCYQESRFYGLGVRLVYGLQSNTAYNPENPVINEDRCIVVKSRDNAEYSWDATLVILTNGFTKGQKWELSMSVKADYEAYSCIPQIHNISGNNTYVGSLLSTMNVLFTTEWETRNYDGTFDFDGQSIVFNLSDDNRANNYYFDNISLKIDGVEVVHNGDCQTDELISCQKKDGGEYNSNSILDFIDKASIKPAQPRNDQEMQVGKQVYAIDYTKETGFRFHKMEEYDCYAPTIDAEDGMISEPPKDEFGNIKDYAYHAADYIPTWKGKRYSVEVLIKGDQAGSFPADLIWDWSEENPSTTTIEFGTKWETKKFVFDKPVPYSTRCRIIFKPGPYTIYVKSLRVIYEGD